VPCYSNEIIYFGLMDCFCGTSVVVPPCVQVMFHPDKSDQYLVSGTQGGTVTVTDVQQLPDEDEGFVVRTPASSRALVYLCHALVCA
jgi:hypothetical protein